MNTPLLNIITRCSRKDSFKATYGSVHSQSYKNINHIVTFETEEMKEWLESFVDKENTTLVRVPYRKQLAHYDSGRVLTISYNHNCCSDDFLNPDWEFLDQRIEPDPFIKGGAWGNVHLQIPPEKRRIGTIDITWREHLPHFPWNLYIKVAERALKEGWVMYLDDDDVYNGDTVLEQVVEEIDKFSEDTLHIFPFVFPNGIDEIPNEPHRNLYKEDHPFIRHQIASANLCFHTKYTEYTQWDEWGGADYRTAKVLEKVIPNKNIGDLAWIKLVTGTNGGNPNVNL